MAGIARNHDFFVLSNGGMEDHVHVLLQLPPVLALSKAVGDLKANSSSWMGEHGIRFAWQEGYGAFSVSASNVARVTRYIQNQADHYRKINVRRRVHRASQKTWNRFRSEICVR